MTTIAAPPKCRAHCKDGSPCGQPPIPGGTVCHYHGGGASQVRRKAALRLIELVDPAIAVLAREMATAEKSAERQAAANSILDRAGVSRTIQGPDPDTARALLIERLVELQQTSQTADAGPDAGAGADAGRTITGETVPADQTTGRAADDPDGHPS